MGAADTAPTDVGCGFAELGVSLGEPPRAALAPAGRVLRSAFAGDAGAELEAVEVGALTALSAALAAGELHLDPRLGCSDGACAGVEALGFMACA